LSSFKPLRNLWHPLSVGCFLSELFKCECKQWILDRLLYCGGHAVPNRAIS